MKETGIIYRAFNSYGMSYVGQTSRGLERRKYFHLYNGGLKDPFHSAINLYGKDYFSWEVLEDNIPVEKLPEMEKYWIAYFDSYENGFNSTKGGEVGMRGKHLSDQTRAKLSAAHKGKSIWNKGKLLSDEHKAKLSAAKKRENNPMYGKPLSDEHKAKISAANKGKNNPMYGRTLTPEHKAKLRDKNKMKGKHWKLVDGHHIYY